MVSPIGRPPALAPKFSRWPAASRAPVWWKSPSAPLCASILYELGGGVPAGYEFKAAQTGGPAGGCIPASHLELPMDYDSLQSIGAIMGSGGLIVMDTSSCMVDVARFFMEFCRGRIVRQMYSLPGGHGPDARYPGAHHARRRRRRRFRNARRTVGTAAMRPVFAVWGMRRPTRYSARCGISAREYEAMCGSIGVRPDIVQAMNEETAAPEYHQATEVDRMSPQPRSLPDRYAL